MAKWNIKEITGRQYVYVSKNATSDVAAANFFGKAAAWVSNGAYAVGDRVTSVSIQYRNKTGVNTTTAPASDTTNWEFDFENYQTYATSRSYLVGHKTNYNNEHYVCINNTTGTFNPAHWNKVIVSNKDVPYKLMNTAVNLVNGDARFVSYESLDYTLNKAYHNIHLILSNGVWNEALTNPTKSIRVVGQSKSKTIISSISTTAVANMFYDTINISNYYIYNAQQGNIRATNCIYDTLSQDNSTNGTTFLFFYKNIVKSSANGRQGYPTICYHFVNNTILGNTVIFFNTANQSGYNYLTIIKNNYFESTQNFGKINNNIVGLDVIGSGNFDYNRFGANPTIGGVSQTSIGMLQATLPNQNISSSYGAVTLNSDYTLPVGSPLINAGSNRNHIGAEGIGYPETTSTILDTANGAIYKNVVKYGSTLIREQISKQAQAGSNNTITLESSASSSDSHYNTFRIYISSGTGSGQTRTITGYDGTTKIATVNSNWTVNPDSTSIYEILDGELTSGIGDLGSVQTVRKMRFSNQPVYKIDQATIDQAVSMTDPRLDNPAGMVYDLKVSNASDLSGASFVRFAQDEEFKVDASGNGCGSDDYNPLTIASNTLTFRYYQVKLMFRK